MNLTDKEIVELRIKCLEPFVAVASKHDMDKMLLVNYAEKAWEYATSTLTDEPKPRPGRPVGSGSK